MSETLWAVIIGGVIGVIGSAVVSIPSLFANHCRWKKEKKLEHLRTERRHREEQYKYLLSKLPEALEENLPGYDIITEVSLDLPEEIFKEIISGIDEMEKNKQEGKKMSTICVTESTATAMKKSLDEIDKKINELMS